MKSSRTILLSLSTRRKSELEWCGPCQKFRPQFHAAASDYDAQFATGLIDENVEGVTALGVTTIPAVVVYKDGEVVGMRSGALDGAQLDDILTEFGVSPIS